MQFKQSARAVAGTDIKFITPDIAIAHVSWGMRGDKDPDGTARKPRIGVMIQVLVKRDGKWTVVAAQNTAKGPVTLGVCCACLGRDLARAEAVAPGTLRLKFEQL